MQKLFLLLAAVLAVACAKGPEGSNKGDCTDGKDNDENGFLDCEDKGCTENAHCKELVRKAIAAEKAAKTAREKAEAEAAAKAAAEAAQPVFELNELMIQRGHNGENVDYNEAKLFCERLKLKGFNNWRLPTREEAVSIAKSKKLKPEPYVMWTSTTLGKKRGIIVGITSGAANTLGLRFDGDCRARCVRSL